MDWFPLPRKELDDAVDVTSMQAIESEEVLIFDGRVRTARRGAQLPVVTTWLGYHGRWLGLPKERRLECGKISHK